MHSLILIPIVVVAVVAWRLHRRWLHEVAARRRLQQRAATNGECIRRLMLVEHGVRIDLTQPIPLETLRMWGWKYDDERIIHNKEMEAA